MATGWTCPSCGNVNEDYRFTCSECGTVQETAAAASEPVPPAADAPRPAGGPGEEPLERGIERGLRAYLADPAALEYVTFSVVGTENVYVQFIVADGVLVGEAVAERFLPAEERHRVNAAALERLGFRLERDANYVRTWPWPPDIGAVSVIAAEALRTYGISGDASLHVSHARGSGPEPDREPVESPIETATPDTRPLWRRIAPQVAVIAVIALVGAIGAWYFNAGRSASGEIAKSGDLPASELRVGDCFDLKDPTAEDVDDVTARVCSEEHEFEVYFVGFLPAGDYPGDPAFSTYVEDECVPAFDAYIGTPYLESEFDVFYFTPTPEAWTEGDRSIQCAVYHPVISRLSGSLKGSAR